VRIGDPTNPQVAFDDPGFLNAQSARVMAGLRLARLRIEAGLTASTDDLALGQAIASDRTISNEAIRTEIDTLTAVAAVRVTPTAPRRLVPRQAGRAPSLAVSEDIPTPQVIGSVSADEMPFE